MKRCTWCRADCHESPHQAWHDRAIRTAATTIAFVPAALCTHVKLTTVSLSESLSPSA